MYKHLYCNVCFYVLQIASGTDVTEVQSLRDLSAGEHITSFTVEDLYLLMGRELDTLPEIPAGNVLGNPCVFSYS